MIIRTRRLLLHPMTPDLVEAQLSRQASFFKRLHSRPRTDWPPPLYDDEALRWTKTRLEGGEDADWHIRVLTTRKPLFGLRTILGVAGFKGPPDENGEVEIGYSIVAPEQRRGRCSEAVAALLAFAFASPKVALVSAHTLSDDALLASRRVLERAGFGGPISTEEIGVVRYELTRDAFLERRKLIREGDSRA
jgi:RimJ/RimL family protein N-acetyltransferase